VASVAARAETKCRLEDLAFMLTDDTAAWLESFVRVAAQAGDAAGEAFARKVGRRSPVTHDVRDVAVHLGTSRATMGRRTVRARFPFHWTVSGYRNLFASLDGYIVLQRAPTGTDVSVVGVVKEPPGMRDPAGRVICRHASQAAVELLVATLQAAFLDRSRELVAGTM
jgi:hypothetical protein